MNTKHILLVLAAIIVLGGIAIIGLGGNDKIAEDTKNDKLSVVASFYPVYFFAQQIGGDRADITNVTPAGAEPHDYEPSPQDIARIEDSQLLVLNGGEVDIWGDRVKQDLDPNKTIVVVAGEGLMVLKMEEHEEEHGHEEEHEGDELVQDPHVWLSPVVASRMVDKIAAGFVQADPDNASYYQSNAASLKSRLADLDADFKQGLNSCSSRDIITSHAAFGYLADAYNLNQVPISGISPDEEPSAQELTEVAKFAKDNNVKYIFFESLVSPKLSQTIASEVGAQTLVLNPLEGLTGEDIASGKNYFTEMESNLANLQTALSCM